MSVCFTFPLDLKTKSDIFWRSKKTWSKLTFWSQTFGLNVHLIQLNHLIYLDFFLWSGGEHIASAAQKYHKQVLKQTDILKDLFVQPRWVGLHAVTANPTWSLLKQILHEADISWENINRVERKKEIQEKYHRINHVIPGICRPWGKNKKKPTHPKAYPTYQQTSEWVRQTFIGKKFYKMSWYEQ